MMQNKTIHSTHCENLPHILVCLSSAPSNEKIIRAAARMSEKQRCPLTALYVKTSVDDRLNRQDQARLLRHRQLVQELGGQVETVFGDDVAQQIASFAHITGSTTVVMGQSAGPQRRLWHTPALTDRLSNLSPELDIHIIPDQAPHRNFLLWHQKQALRSRWSPQDGLKIFFVLTLVTLLGLWFDHLGFSEAAVVTLYILGVMVVSVTTHHLLNGVAASILGVLTFHFFFANPQYSFQAYDKDYPVTFLVMLIASLFTGSLAARLKWHAGVSARSAQSTRLLLETNRILQTASNAESILHLTARQLLKIFGRDVVLYRRSSHGITEPDFYLLSDDGPTPPYDLPEERGVAEWVMANNKKAGAQTHTLPGAAMTYFAIRMGRDVFGVLGIATREDPLDAFEMDILLAVLGECALVLENQKNMEEKEAAAVLAENEQLQANLLRSISHDLRTPLTAISGNAANLLSHGTQFDEKTRRQIYNDIFDDAEWLINLVENLLSVSRLENERIQLHLSTELIDEVVAEALRHVHRQRDTHRVHIQESESFIFAKMETKLVVQVLINLIDNAMKYTPEGSDISIFWSVHDGFVWVSVADNGPGISNEDKSHIFDMFYVAKQKLSDQRRSMGLGLALCKAVIRAHGGDIWVQDHSPQGSIFTFSLPREELTIDE